MANFLNKRLLDLLSEMGLILAIGVSLVVVLLTALGWLYLFYQKKFRYWGEKNVPHANPVFFFGNLKGLGTEKDLFTLYKELYQQFKGVRYFGIWQFFQPCLMITDPDLIKNICVTDFMSFHDHGVYINEKKDPLSANLFSIEGTKWRNTRVKLTPTFTSGKLKMMIPIMNKYGEELEKLLRSFAEKGDIVEVKELVARFSTDVIASVAFGIESNALKDPECVFRRMGKKVLKPSWSMIIRNLLAVMVPDVARILDLAMLPEDVSKFFIGTVKETMDYRETNGVKRNDFLQLLIQLKNKGYIEDVDSTEKEKIIDDGNKFTLEQASAQAFIFFIGGFETSSATLQFTLLELALNQEIQNRARDEIKKVLAKHGNEVTYDSLSDLEYTGRIIDETLRKYAPAAAMSRMCNKDYNVPDSDLVIKKGTLIIIPAIGLHHDEKYFPNPDVFDPDRFTEEQKATRHKYSYMPFGEGPRMCIGQRFALLQIRVAIVHLLRNFRFDHVPEHMPLPIEFDPKSMMVMPKGGVKLKISLV